MTLLSDLFTKGTGGGTNFDIMELISGPIYSVSDYDNWDEDTQTGSGTITKPAQADAEQVEVETGTTSGSEVAVQEDNTSEVLRAQNELGFGLPLFLISSTTNGESWVWVQQSGSASFGADEGFGLKLEADALYGLVNDGASKNKVDLGITLPILSDGVGLEPAWVSFYYNGNLAQWFVDGEKKGETGNNLPDFSKMISVEYSCKNNGDSANQSIICQPITFIGK